MQSSHRTAALWDTVPGIQSRQADRPVVFPKLPAAQPRQELKPEALAKKPCAQRVQLPDAFTALKLPTAHSTHAEKLLLLKKPGVQKSHTDSPFSEVK